MGDAYTPLPLIQAQRFEQTHQPVPILNPDELSEEQLRMLVGGRILNANVLTSGAIHARFDRTSVYGQTLALPQIARSAGWPRGLSSVVARTFLYLALNLILQAMVLIMIHKEEHVMDSFAGQVHLCDFGAFIQKSASGPDSIGPTGTQYSVARLYSWDQWIARDFVKTSLLALFPERLDDISERVDPGEYGLEDYSCRLVAIFIFMLAMMEELLKILRSSRLLYLLPSKSEPWILYNGELSDKDVNGPVTQFEGDFQLKIAGMSRAWKMFNIIFVVIPRLLIFKLTVQAGATFLIDTAGIEDVIVNCTALAFCLTIDDMIFELLNDRSTKAIMRQMEEFEHQEDVNDVRDDQELRSSGFFFFTLVSHLIPFQLIIVILMSFLAVVDYYLRSCTLREGGGWIGGWISRPISEPFDVDMGLLSLLDAFFPHLWSIHSATESPLWTMPEPHGAH